MKVFDWLCAGALFALAIAHCLLVLRTYTGRIWIFGTGLALLFTAMLNVLRIRNGGAIKSLKLFCISANVTMLVFVISLMASIWEIAYATASASPAGRNAAISGDGFVVGKTP
jgi:hypothetical protein